ncbi:DNA double-strand break repair helicase HerA [uncultured archaeon]|nr:DNA double-strand break repair helicase HerA [uncultured archaeon]
MIPVSTKQPPAPRLGTVIATPESPSTTEFSFVVQGAASTAGIGQFVECESEGQRVFGVVKCLTRANPYFERADAVADYAKTKPETAAGSPGAIGGVSDEFPIAEWDHQVAQVQAVGALDDKSNLSRVRFPPAPGSSVKAAHDADLSRVLHLDPHGLAVGKLLAHDVPVTLSPHNLLQKHLAILGMSGSGKSVAASVLIEELLTRKKEYGRLAIVAFDVHGDYLGFAGPRTPQFAEKTRVIAGSQVKIAARHLTPKFLAHIMPDASPAALREFQKITTALRAEKQNAFDLADIVKAIEDADMRDNVRAPLLDFVASLADLDLFGTADFPNVERDVKPGELTLFDLSTLDDNRVRQIIVSHYGNHLFRLRRQNTVPPYLMVVEEAHNFAPEKTASDQALSRRMIETVAREGRKFGACLCLVSQRPVNLSITALSQCNSMLVMRITNPYDVEHIAQTSEGIDAASKDQITGLRVGEGILLGEAAGMPLFVRIRNRTTPPSPKSKTLDALAREFEELNDVRALSPAQAKDAFA